MDDFKHVFAGKAKEVFAEIAKVAALETATGDILVKLNIDTGQFYQIKN